MGAFLASGAALAVVIAALVLHPLQLIAAVLLIALAVAASWAALVRRGIRRVAWAIVAVLALVAAGALPGLRTYLVLALVVAFVALSLAAARYALAGARHPAAVAVGPARRGVLLLNPRSGGGKVARFGLSRRAAEIGVVTVPLHPGEDLRALAEQAVKDGADVLGMAGGDGSQALVADVARRHGLPFVCVPAGTRNHFALDLGLDRADVSAALAAFGGAVERRVDLALLGDRVFVNNASLGVYATVVQAPGYREAKMTTVAGQLPDLLGPDAPRPDLRFDSADGTRATSADMVLVSNGAYRLDHLDGFGSRPRLNTGRLGVVTVTVDRARDVPALVSAELAGRLSGFHGYRSWVIPEFVVDSAESLIDVGVDGEALRLPPPLRFRSLPGALRVRIPRDAPGVPATAPGFRDAVAALSLVVAGRPPH
ncbi:MAG TPA: diacylglycerol kinase family protein [Pseudonocardiaceae bacterium]|nr:diacylglycerol kinase family protein [Pseudonocardiaceae bacterium]